MMAPHRIIMRLIAALMGILAVGSAQADRISGRVWEDLNRNGIQDPYEPEIPNLWVYLREGSTSNFLGGVQTSAEGGYSFTNLPDGLYFVQFWADDVFAATVRDAGDDDSVDSDIDDFGATHVFQLSGSPISNVDAGFYRVVPNLSLTVLANGLPRDAPLYVTNGTWVTFTYIVTNTGETRLTLFIFDDFIEDIVLCPFFIFPEEAYSISTNIQIVSSVTNIVEAVGIPVNKSCILINTEPDAAFDIRSIGFIVSTNLSYQVEKTVVEPVGRPAHAGEAISFRIDILNTGDTPLTIPEMWDVYDPANLTYSFSVPPASPDHPGFLNWLNIGPVQPGASTSILVHFQVSTSMYGGYGTNATHVHASFPPLLTNRMVESGYAVYQTSSAGDSDDDGLPDWWEELHFGGATNANAQAPAASGVHTVLESYIADLNPNNPTSVFPVIALTNPPPGAMTLVVDPTSTARVYQVRWSTNLLALPQEWNLLPPEKTGTGAAVMFTITNEAPGRSYRTGVRLP